MWRWGLCVVRELSSVLVLFLELLFMMMILKLVNVCVCMLVSVFLRYLVVL